MFATSSQTPYCLNTASIMTRCLSNQSSKANIHSNFFSKKKLNQKLLDYLNKQIYQKIMSAAISTSINNLVLSEKSQQLDALKEFLTSKLDDADQICSMIDDFSSLSLESKVKIKIGKTSKSSSKNKGEKRRRRKSYYSHYMSVRLKAYSEEHKGDKVDRGERIKFCTAEYNKHKETPEFKKLKDEWDAKTSSGSDENEVDEFKKPETPSKKLRRPKRLRSLKRNRWNQMFLIAMMRMR